MGDDTARKPVIAVIGAGACDEATEELAHEVGRLVARAGYVLVTGGLGGVMEAASCGANAGGGIVLGLLPGSDPTAAPDGPCPRAGPSTTPGSRRPTQPPRLPVR